MYKLNIGDKVIIIPLECAEFNQLKFGHCCSSIYGISQSIYQEYVGKEFTINTLRCDSNGLELVKLEEDKNYLWFPLYTIKKYK